MDRYYDPEPPSPFWYYTPHKPFFYVYRAAYRARQQAQAERAARWQTAKKLYAYEQQVRRRYRRKLEMGRFPSKSRCGKMPGDMHYKVDLSWAEANIRSALYEARLEQAADRNNDLDRVRAPGEVF